MSLQVRFHDILLSVCQMPADCVTPVSILTYPFTAFLRTPDEVTLICPTELVPNSARAEHGFIPLELIGPFAFHLTGILTQIANPLAAAGISILALSTFNTDFVLIKKEQSGKARIALSKAGHVVHENTLIC